MTDYRLGTFSQTLHTNIANGADAPHRTSPIRPSSCRRAQKCAKKLGEEAVEIVLASSDSDKRNVISRGKADLLYHLLVLLEATGVTLADVMAELSRRQGVSGIAEKASRPKD